MSVLKGKKCPNSRLGRITIFYRLTRNERQLFVIIDRIRQIYSSVI